MKGQLPHKAEAATLDSQTGNADLHKSRSLRVALGDLFTDYSFSYEQVL